MTRLVSDSIQPVDWARTFQMIQGMQQNKLAAEEHRFRLDSLYEARDKRRAFNEALQNDDAEAARRADPAAWSQMQEQQLGVRKSQLDMAKATQEIGDKRTASTQNAQRLLTDVLKADPGAADMVRERRDQLVQGGVIDHFPLPGEESAQTWLPEGQAGPQVLPTEKQIAIGQRMAGTEDPLAKLSEDEREFARTSGLTPGQRGWGQAFDAWKVRLRKAGATNVSVGGKILGTAAVAELSDLDTAIGSVDQLTKDYIATVPNKGTGDQLGARLTSLVPNTTTSQYQNNADVAAQSIGTILEGGKLTETDLQRYKRMLPQPGDSPDTAKRKADNMRAQLRRKLSDRKGNFDQAGYRVPGQGKPVPTYRSNETDALMDSLLQGGQ